MKTNAKLLLVGLVSETVVAQFNCVADAFHCGSLLQASTEDKNLHYVVEYKDFRGQKRQMADDFTRRLPFINKATKQAVQNYFS